MYQGRKIKLYREGHLGDIFNRAYRLILAQIEQKDENEILNISEQQYAEFLIQDHLIDIPVLDFENMSVESVEKEISADKFPRSFDVLSGEKIKKDVIVYHIPYTGDINILRNRGLDKMVISGGSIEVGVRTDTITTEIISFNDNPEKIKKEFESNKKRILSNYTIIKKDCERFNNYLLDFALVNIQQRKKKLLSKNSLLSSLGVPLKKSSSVAKTFAVPKPELRKKIIVEPKVYDEGFSPEPTLSKENFEEILKIIYDVGKNFERMPSTYTSKGEEDLRDHILFVLDPNFILGSASGETFNKNGRTDILLRYDSEVVFVAECKFWTGKKGYLATIDQLLSYLTFRNSKTSVVLFVRNKDMSNVISTISEFTESHSNYVRSEKKSGETWWNFIFHLNGDSNREVNLGVLAFHIPN